MTITKFIFIITATFSLFYSCGGAGPSGTFSPIQGKWKKAVGSSQLGLYIIDGSNYQFGNISRTNVFTPTYKGITDYFDTTISFRDYTASGGALVSPCPNIAGNYTFVRVADTLTLTLINDPCRQRPNDYIGRWLFVQ